MTDISPKFELHWDKRSKNAQVNSLTHKNGLTVTCCNLDEYIEIEETASTLTVIIGHPFLGDKIDVAGTIDHLAQDRDLKDINGQFLFIIFNKKLATLKIINDRFTSFPVYFANLNNHFILNISLAVLMIYSKVVVKRMLYYKILGPICHSCGTRITPTPTTGREKSNY